MFRSECFKCKKWSLFIVASFGIFFCMLIVIMASSIAVSMTKSDPSTNNDEVKGAAKTFLIVAGIIGILINLLGLIGACEEHLCMTIAYGLIMTGNTFGCVSLALKMQIHWYSPVISCIIAILALSYAKDLYNLRHQIQDNNIFVTPLLPQTVIDMHSEYDGQQNISLSLGWQPPPAYDSHEFNNSNKF